MVKTRVFFILFLIIPLFIVKTVYGYSIQSSVVVVKRVSPTTIPTKIISKNLTKTVTTTNLNSSTLSAIPTKSLVQNKKETVFLLFYNYLLKLFKIKNLG